MFGGNAGRVGGARARAVGHAARHADQVAEHQRRGNVALAKDEGLRLKRIFDASAEPLIEVAAHAVADRRGNVDRGNAGQKGLRGVQALRRCYGASNAMSE